MEIAFHAVYLYALCDIARYDTVVVPLLGKVAVMAVGRAVGKEQGALYVALDGALVGASEKNSSWKRFTCSRASTGRFCERSCARASISDLPSSSTYIFCRCASAKQYAFHTEYPTRSVQTHR